MQRWRASSVVTVTIIASALLTIACAGPEEELVDRFLAASQQDDNQMVAALSMVSLPEEVVSWDVLEVVDLPDESYTVPRLRERVREAEHARDAQFKTMGAFREKHYDDLRRIQNRTLDDPEYRFKGPLGDLQAEWERQRQDRDDVVRRLREAQIALEQEIRQVTKSLQRESSAEYLKGKASKRAVIVRIQTPASEKTYRIILTRYELKNQFDALVPSRFIITGVSEDAG